MREDTAGMDYDSNARLYPGAPYEPAKADEYKPEIDVLLLEDEEFTENIVGDYDEDCNKELDEVNIGNIDTEDADQDIVLRHIAGILHDHNGQGEQTEFESKESKQTRRHKADELFLDVSFRMEDEELVRDISEHDSDYPGDRIYKRNEEIEAPFTDRDRPFYFKDLSEDREGDQVNDRGKYTEYEIPEDLPEFLILHQFFQPGRLFFCAH